MTVSSFPILLVAAFLAALSLPGRGEEALQPLTVEEAKFQMFQLYSKAKLPQTKLRQKYPKLLKADKMAREATKAYGRAVQNHPDLKEEFEEISQREISIPEKMKLQAPLFQKAETLASLKDIRTKYNQARVAALKAEIEALRNEGHIDLAGKMSAILGRVKS